MCILKSTVNTHQTIRLYWFACRRRQMVRAIACFWYDAWLLKRKSWMILICQWFTMSCPRTAIPKWCQMWVEPVAWSSGWTYGSLSKVDKCSFLCLTADVDKLNKSSQTGSKSSLASARKRCRVFYIVNYTVACGMYIRSGIMEHTLLIIIYLFRQNTNQYADLSPLPYDHVLATGIART